jgi:hypothetical protein
VLSGLGAQLNYTYVHQSGINNSNLFTASSSGDVGAFGAGQQSLGGTGSVLDSHRLAGISDHTFNAVALYEKGPVGFRLAYNWRSRYLTQNLDCCIGLPVFQKSAGFLDGSLRLSVNRFLELSVDASNLLNTTTVYQQQIFGDSPQTPDAAAGVHGLRMEPRRSPLPVRRPRQVLRTLLRAAAIPRRRRVFFRAPRS